MGFYGNITNTSRTQFQFDRTYPNRVEMEANKLVDGIYAGRFVLVEYDSENNLDTYQKVTATKQENGLYIVSPVSDSNPNGVFFGEEEAKQKPVVYSGKTDNIIGLGDCIFYLYTETLNSNGYALYEEAISTSNNYTKNYHIDTKAYGEGRGYDSTVWQKVYSDGYEKYVMIAELNSVVPAFDISADAPSQVPIAPHFDARSTDVYYKLHWQPQWGFRIGSATKENSDTDTVWLKSEIDEVTGIETLYYYDYEAKKWENANVSNATSYKTMPGAIYFNKAGFDKEKRSNKNGDNYIKLDEASSGNKYNLHDGSFGIGAKPDIKEMKINLPGIGNALSDFWDVVYGEERNLALDWGDTTGLRMIVNAENGYDFDTEEGITTVAGCINSVHDLMGMIVHEIPESLEDINDNTIYYDNGKFYRAKTLYEYTPLELSNPAYSYELLENSNLYQPSTLFIKEGQNYIADEVNIWQEGKEYYTRKLSVNFIEITNDVVDYVKDTYYYADGLNFVRDSGEDYLGGKNYYSIVQPAAKTFLINYTADTLFNKVGDNWEKAMENIPVVNKNYYQLEPVPVEGMFPFVAGKYAKKVGEGEFVNNVGQWEEGADWYEFVYDSSSNKYTYTGIDLFNPASGEYYKLEDKDYDRITDAQEVIYYTIAQPTQTFTTENMYYPNMYYYMVDNNYIRGVEEGFVTREGTTEAVPYYDLRGNSSPNPLTFYEPNTFFYKKNPNDEEEIPEYDSSGSVTEGRIYYLYGDEYYVTRDNKSAFNIGALWNNYVETVPSSVELSKRESEYTLVELVGFARTLNTIHGIILRMNKLLEDGDLNTRDTGTLQGAINKLNDIFYKFDDLKPTQFLTIGNTGKIYSTTWDSDQEFAATEVARFDVSGQEVQKAAPANKEQAWIALDLDDINHHYTVKHMYNPIEGENTEYDLNGNGDKVRLHIPIIDATGHVVGHSYETLTLPFGYKSISTNAFSTDEENDLDTVENAKQTIADNTQDGLEINTVNKWLQIAVNDDKIELAHEIHPINKNDKTSTNYNDTAAMGGIVDTITLQDLIIDNAGHATALQNHEYTLPYGYKHFVIASQSASVNNPGINTNTISADNTQDTMTLSSSNKWIRMSADVNSDNINIGHEVHTIETTAKSTTDLDNIQTFDVQDLLFDDAGHVTANQKHTYKLPDGFKFVKVGTASTGTANGQVLNGTIEANDQVSALNINPDNRWITLYANTNTDTLIIGHAYPDSTKVVNTTVIGNEIPQFGATFSIPEVKYDEAGHISGVATHTVMIPKGSLNGLAATSSSVLTGISMVPETGAITQTNADVGTLLLTGYTVPTGGQVGASDSINGAIYKLDSRIYTEEENRKSEIARVDGRLDILLGDTSKIKPAFDTIAEMSEWLEANDTELAEGLVAADNALGQRIDEEISARESAISGLETRIGNEETKREEEITRVEGLVSAETQTREEQVQNLASIVGTAAQGNTPASGHEARILELESQVAAANEKITNLEAMLNAFVLEVKPDFVWPPVEESEPETDEEATT